MREPMWEVDIDMVVAAIRDVCGEKCNSSMKGYWSRYGADVWDFRKEKGRCGVAALLAEFFDLYDESIGT